MSGAVAKGNRSGATVLERVLGPKFSELDDSGSVKLLISASRLGRV